MGRRDLTVMPSSVWILIIKKGEVVWYPRPPRIARFGLIGTWTGIVSI
jgi:hypothetical protein